MHFGSAKWLAIAAMTGFFAILALDIVIPLIMLAVMAVVDRALVFLFLRDSASSGDDPLQLQFPFMEGDAA